MQGMSKTIFCFVSSLNSDLQYKAKNSGQKLPPVPAGPAMASVCLFWCLLFGEFLMRCFGEKLGLKINSTSYFDIDAMKCTGYAEI